MAWHLYRRHRRDCVAGRPYDSRSGEFDEHRKGWKRCGCRILDSSELVASGDQQAEFDQKRGPAFVYKTRLADRKPALDYRK